MMKILAPLCALLVLALARRFELDPLSDEEIFYINSLSGSTWTAGRNFYPNELARAKRMLGVNMAENREYNKKHIKTQEIIVSDDLPDNFDPRTKWTQCPSLNEIRDQSNCGSCWAFGVAEAVTDRICIRGGGQVHISAEDINDCCKACGNGCNGGFPAAVYNWYVKDGIVTGGQYGTNEGCQPYSLPHCDHHTTGKYPNCTGDANTPQCRKACRTGYNQTYTEDKRKGSKSYAITTVQEIMQDLVDNGPVTAAFTVYSDFLSYKTGVYKHVTGEELGGHAVKIIGYGVENGQNYWLVANSWNEDWGDKGFFKIARGNDECGIESEITAGEPKL
jgi:cathepsin B